jgi:hypothetical protein
MNTTKILQVLLATSLLCLQAFGAVSSAANPVDYGFAWVSISASVGPTYSYNTSGGPITVSRSSPGIYTVSFADLGGPGGNVQVVAYGSDSTRCKVSGWGSSGSTQNVGVRCHTPSGSLVNSAFVVQYERQTSGGDRDGAYLVATQPSTSSYDLEDSPWSWNSTGGTNHITRTGTGTYEVSLPGLGAWAGSVKVTAYGGSGGEHCNVGGWGPSGSEQEVTVRCFGTSGAAVDTFFSLNYFGNHEVSVYNEGAYALAHSATLASYEPVELWSYNSGIKCLIGSNLAGRFSTGRYFMRHTLIDDINSSVHVTAYGTDSKYCKVERWSPFGDGVEVRSRCYASTGSLSDTQYVETYAVSRGRSPCPAE